MMSFGYGDLELEEILDRIADGYQEHMDGKRASLMRSVLFSDIRRLMWRDSSRRKAEISVFRILESIWKSGRYVKNIRSV